MSEEALEIKRKVEVIYSPALFPVYFDNQDCVVVVIDIFRATSAICSALESGVKSIIPVATMEEASAYKEKGFKVGAERKAEIVEGFDFGNSPVKFQSGEFKDETIVLTTTNGTKAIGIAKNAKTVVVGAFTNITALCDFLEKQDKDVLLLCAGWKDRFNLEDTLFAGAVAANISKNNRFSDLSDSSVASIHLYNQAKGDMDQFLNTSSHRKRLSRLSLEDDIAYCLKSDLTKIVPILKGNELVPYVE